MDMSDCIYVLHCKYTYMKLYYNVKYHLLTLKWILLALKNVSMCIISNCME